MTTYDKQFQFMLSKLLYNELMKHCEIEKTKPSELLRKLIREELAK